MRIIRLKKGESLVKTLLKEIVDVESGIIFGIGALKEATLKIYDLNKKEYTKKKFEGNLEVGSFTAVIAKNPDGTVGIHPHIVISQNNFKSICGHLEEATVAATFEAIIVEDDKKIGRYFDKGIGLNLLNL